MTVMERKGAEAKSAEPAIKQPDTNQVSGRGADQTVFAILAALSFSHFLNDMIQSLLPAI